MVAWLIALNVFVSIVAQYCNKILVHRDAPDTVVNKMYVWCFVVALAVAVVFHPARFLPTVTMVGAINAVAVWLFARSLRYGVTQTFLVIPLTNSLAAALSVVFLSEWKIFALASYSGRLRLASVFLLLTATLLFSLGSRVTKKDQRFWAGPLIGFILITGTVSFLIKYFALQSHDVSTYLFSWYTGTLLGSLLLRFFAGSWRSMLSRGLVNGWYVVMALATVVSMISSFIILSRSPAAIVFPIIAAFYTGGMVLVGLFVFKERKSFLLYDWLGTFLGFLGVLSIVAASW